MNIIRRSLSTAKRLYLNTPGFHTERKLVLFESDDWGSIRMPSREVFDALNQAHPITDGFLRNDALERREDLEALFSLLGSFTDCKGRHPCITANFAMANPDFDRIDPAQGVYHHERFTDTYARLYGPENGLLQLILQGEQAHIFKPQLHAREHLNITRWMRDLKAGKPDACTAFAHRTLDVQASLTKASRFGYMDALNYDSRRELPLLSAVLAEAAALFEETFGYRSKTFVASCFIWSGEIEKLLHREGVRLLQTAPLQNVCPGKGTSPLLKKPHYTGQRNLRGQVYSVRNCEYEPVYDHDIPRRVERCLADIDKAFAGRKPAIVDTHRVNYIGSIHPDNARLGREGLHLLLTQLLQRHPDVEFLSTDELCDMMAP